MVSKYPRNEHSVELYETVVDFKSQNNKNKSQQLIINYPANCVIFQKELQHFSFPTCLPPLKFGSTECTNLKVIKPRTRQQRAIFCDVHVQIVQCY